MKNKITNIESLTMYLNKSQFDTTNSEIAMYLFEHRDEIGDKSLKQLCAGSFISQPSFTRFFNKYGIEKYQDFRISYAIGDYGLKNVVDGYKKNNIEDIEKLKEELIEKQIACINQLKNLDVNKLLEMINLLKEYHRVVFIGSDFSMAILRSLQSAMISKGVHAYTLFDPIGQENMIHKLDENDLVVAVSIKGRWYDNTYSKSTIESLHQSKCCKMLWMCEEHHKDEELFNYVYQFGSNINEFGYTQLMNFIPYLLTVYLNQ